MNLWMWRARWTCAVVAPVVLALTGCGGKKGGGKEFDPALARKAARGDLVETVSESGTVVPLYEVEIKAKVSGEAVEVLVDEGDEVKKGQLLMRLDDTEYANKTTLAERDRDEAAIAWRSAQTALEHKEAGWKSGGVAQSDYEQAVQQAELEHARLNRTEVALKIARQNLDYTRIYSPSNGKVIVRNVEPGELVPEGRSSLVNGEPAMKIARVERLFVDLDLNQVDIAKVKLEQTASILLDAYPNIEAHGSVVQIAEASHRNTDKNVDLFKVRVALDALPDGVVAKPGMTGEVRIAIGTYTNVIKAPTEAVFTKDGKSYVYVVGIDPKTKEKTTTKTPVEIGHRGGREVEITSGLKETDEVYAQDAEADEDKGRKRP